MFTDLTLMSALEKIIFSSEGLLLHLISYFELFYEAESQKMRPLFQCKFKADSFKAKESSKMAVTRVSDCILVVTLMSILDSVVAI